MKFPTFIEVKLNGYKCGGKKKISSNSKKSNPKHETGQEVDMFVRNSYGFRSNQMQLARSDFLAAVSEDSCFGGLILCQMVNTGVLISP